MKSKTVRYYATLKGRPEPLPVDVEPLPGGRYAVTVDGQRHELDALMIEPDTASLLFGDAAYSVEFEAKDDSVGVLLGHQVVRMELVDERRSRMRAASAGFQAEGRQVVTAPMPGKVVRVLVRQGDEVQEGQGLVVIEAMKMENELKSPKAGKVVELATAEGGTVENGAKLVVVE